MSLLEIKDLRAFYHGTPVIHGISLLVEERGFVSVIGSNGAGKSTLLRSISGLVDATGSLWFAGEQLSRLNARACVKRGIIHCPEGRLLFPHMSVLQNLRMGAYLRRDFPQIERDLERVFDYLPILSHRRKQLAGTLSGGEQQMVAVGRAIMASPRLLLLDEPSFGLAPLVVSSIVEVIQRLNQEGVSILLVEQNAALALDISKYVYVLEEGRVVDEGAAESLAAKDSVVESYLGMA